MSIETILNNYRIQYNELRLVVEKSQERTLQQEPDDLFYDHQNVFVKSYLVSACSILEAFVQDLAHFCALAIQTRLNEANLPNGIIPWITKVNKEQPSVEKIILNISKNDIESKASPNFYVTLSLFSSIGIDINKEEVNRYKDFVMGVISKRNKIVHHNDNASDLSFGDVILTIREFESYSETLLSVVSRDPFVLHTPSSASA